MLKEQFHLFKERMWFSVVCVGKDIQNFAPILLQICGQQDNLGCLEMIIKSVFMNMCI